MPTLTELRKKRDRSLSELLQEPDHRSQRKLLEELATVYNPREAAIECGLLTEGSEDELEFYIQACESVADAEHVEYVRLTGRRPRFILA